MKNFNFNCVFNMHCLPAFLLVTTVAFSAYSQEIKGISQTYSFDIAKEEMPPMISISDISFSKNVLNANENAQLSITLKNTGYGNARNVTVNLSGGVQGLTFPSVSNVPVIDKESGTQTISIDFKAGIDIPTADAIVKIEIIEPNFKVKIKGKQLTFKTAEFRKPEIILAKSAVIECQSSSLNNQIDLNEVIALKFAVQNIGQGTAESVKASVTNSQKGVMYLGQGPFQKTAKKQDFTVASITSGKYDTVSYYFYVTSEFSEQNLAFNIKTTEKYGKYGFNETKSVPVNTNLSEEGYIRKVPGTVKQETNTTVKIEDIPDFEVDVDVNIPPGEIINDKTFALIIANEDYKNESKVPFAGNDGRIFKEYCIKTLGIPESNIRYKLNATFGETGESLKWLTNIIKNYKGEASCIFYYAGHGFPDAQTKKAYLLLTDGSAGTIESAYCLDTLYSKLTRYPAKKAIAIIDACFSGSKRESGGMLAENKGARITRINPNMASPPGSIVILTAATGEQAAYPYKDKKHGMFTYFLLKKLQSDKGNTIISDLLDYVKTNVAQKSSIDFSEQTPMLIQGLSAPKNWESWKLK